MDGMFQVRILCFMKKNRNVEMIHMLQIARKDGYILYYDEKHNEYLVVTPNYKITRYRKRLGNVIADYFEEKIRERENYEL